jgi:hypothetical protein
MRIGLGAFAFDRVALALASASANERNAKVPPAIAESFRKVLLLVDIDFAPQWIPLMC